MESQSPARDRRREYEIAPVHECCLSPIFTWHKSDTVRFRNALIPDFSFDHEAEQRRDNPIINGIFEKPGKLPILFSNIYQ